ncbi:MAG: GTP 3',8-cyclase MoaA [Elusimicrobia bacterium]|nr:GTP 3',8-cyclase MoaA [Elusimicrobiota bacterium]
MASRPPALLDGFGRAARKLRVSVTDRCDLRCVYCMPERPVWLPRAELLSYEELARLAAVAASRGVTQVRVTGGEPLIRRDVHRFVALLKAVPGLAEVAMTTNGTRLAAQAAALKAAGLDRVTVSLDSLDAGTYRAMARVDGLSDTLAGLDAAEAAGFGPIKVNCVVMRGVNDSQVADLAAWGRRTGRELRFIEFMPLEGDAIWDRSLMVPASEIAAAVIARFAAVERPGAAHSTSVSYDYADGRGSFAVIAPVTRAFCADCDRVRVTADGTFRTCLFAERGADLRGPLRAGAGDAELALIMADAVSRKGPGHLIGLPGFHRPDRAMNAIGG